MNLILTRLNCQRSKFEKKGGGVFTPLIPFYIYPRQLQYTSSEFTIHLFCFESCEKYGTFVEVCCECESCTCSVDKMKGSNSFIINTSSKPKSCSILIYGSTSTTFFRSRFEQDGTRRCLLPRHVSGVRRL